MALGLIKSKNELYASRDTLKWNPNIEGFNRISSPELEEKIIAYKKAGHLKCSECILMHFEEQNASIIDTTEKAIREYESDCQLDPPVYTRKADIKQKENN